MAFNTLTFILFFAVILAVHQLPLSWRARKRNLLIASYVFYSAWNPPLILLLWISTAIDWWAAQRIATQEVQASIGEEAAIQSLVFASDDYAELKAARSEQREPKYRCR